MNNEVVKISEEATIKNLTQFFSSSQQAFEVTPQEIFSAVGREQNDYAKNMAWLSNKLSAMRHYDLFERVYSNDNKPKLGRAKLLKIVLTEKGQKALNKNQREQTNITPVNAPANNDNDVNLETLETINHLISLVKRKMPNWKLELVDDHLVLRSKARD